jgi:hypothetical protein
MLIFLILMSCTPTKFIADNKAKVTPPAAVTPAVTDSEPTTSNQVSPTNGNSTPPATQTCIAGYKPARIAYIIDNSASHGADPSKQVDYDILKSQGGSFSGTDPLFIGGSVRGKRELFTRRQSAVYQSIMTIWDIEKKASVSQGTDIGLAYFPTGKDSNNRDLLDPVYVYGNDKILKSKLTSLKDLQLDQDSQKDQVWKLLDFTYKSQGITPYLSGMNAAYNILKTDRNPNDTRQDIVIFITDGLPTDAKLSDVIKRGQDLAPTFISVISLLYTTSILDEAKNTSQLIWNRYNDPDQLGSFAAYWQAVLDTPKKLAQPSNLYMMLSDFADLDNQLKTLIQTQLSCQ